MGRVRIARLNRSPKGASLLQPAPVRKHTSGKIRVGAALIDAEHPANGQGIEPLALNEMIAELRTQLMHFFIANQTCPTSSSVSLDRRTRKRRTAECLTLLERMSRVAVQQVAQQQQLQREVTAAKIDWAAMPAAVGAAKADEKRARYLAMHDSITTLPNERYVHEQLEQAIMKCQTPWDSMALLYIDLDGFKAVNETYGRDIGNDVLRVIAARLRRIVRAEDIVGRVGGDEFVCVLTGSPKQDQVSRIACHLFDKISAAITFGGLSFSIRSSIGIAMYPQDGATTATLLRTAERAMYQAKRAQSGPLFFLDGIDAERRTLIPCSTSHLLQ